MKKKLKLRLIFIIEHSSLFSFNFPKFHKLTKKNTNKNQLARLRTQKKILRALECGDIRPLNDPLHTIPI